MIAMQPIGRVRGARPHLVTAGPMPRRPVCRPDWSQAPLRDDRHRRGG